MNTHGHGWRRLIVGAELSALGWMLAACNLPAPQADPVRHFTLSEPAAVAAGPGATVRPVQLAGHLRNRAMAIRVSANEVIYDEDARWAEPLDEAVTALLRARIGPAGAGSVITVRLQRCELVRAEANAVVVSALWTITSAAGEVRQGVFNSAPRTWDGRDKAALVGLIREAVHELGDALAAAARPGP
jgi:uncharacterized lipoprotein YmbA